MTNYINVRSSLAFPLDYNFLSSGIQCVYLSYIDEQGIFFRNVHIGNIYTLAKLINTEFFRNSNICNTYIFAKLINTESKRGAGGSSPGSLFPLISLGDRESNYDTLPSVQCSMFKSCFFCSYLLTICVCGCIMSTSYYLEVLK